MNQDLLTYVDKLIGKRVLVIGDFTLDRFIVGSVSRISPEAPVPVVDVEYESYVLGGVANIVNNIQGLGGEALIVTAVGDDPEGDYLLRELEKRGISTQNIFRDKNLTTTVVTRVRSNNGYHLLRMEKGSVGRLSSIIADKLTESVERLIKEKPVDVFLISDYGHGVMTPKLISNVLQLAKDAGKKVVVNPKKDNFWYYDGVNIIRTNRKEASYVTGISLVNETSIRNMGIKILSTLNCEAVLISWVEGETFLFKRNGQVISIPPVIDRPIDVVGVGDAIAATLALGITTENDFEKASELANYAGAFVASKEGLTFITRTELKEFIKKHRREEVR